MVAPYLKFAVILGIIYRKMIPRVQPVASFEDNIEEAVNDDGDFWDEIGGPEVPICQEVVDQSEFISQRVRVQIREYRLLPTMTMKLDLGGKKKFSNPLDCCVIISTSLNCKLHWPGGFCVFRQH